MSTKNPQKRTKDENSFIEVINTCTDEKLLSLLVELKGTSNLFFLEALLQQLAENVREARTEKAIIDFISNLKEPTAAEIISEFIEQNNDKLNLTKIITASWQGSLDFSKHIPIFVEILVSGDYSIAFEAFTLLENHLHALTSEELEKCQNTIAKALPLVDEDKQRLLQEMIKLMDSLAE